MALSVDTDTQGESANMAMMNQLKTTFAQLPHDIELIYFTQKFKDDIFNETTRQIVRAFRELTSKISFREFDMENDLAKKWSVKRPSTLLIAPDRYNIRWLGAPMGEEGRTFLETLILVGLGQSNLSEAAVSTLKKIDSPRTVKVFVSASCPYCPQQAVNAVKAAIEAPEMVSVELIDIQANADLADEYSAHSVPQTFADDVLIGQGAQTEELFAASLLKMEPQTIFVPDVEGDLIETDLVVVGGGPAGLTAGIYSERAGLKTAVIEKGVLGGQVATTAVVENYPGFQQVGGKTLVDIMVSHALQYVQIFQGEEVIDIHPGDPMEIVTTRRRFKTRAMLLATGANNRKIGVPGEMQFAGRGVSYCATCDGPLFKNKEIIMVGGGNGAVTEALHLHHLGIPVTLVHRRDAFRAQEYLTKNIHDNNIPVLWNTEIKEIRGKERVEDVVLVNSQTGETRVHKTDGVFIAIGYEPAVSLAQKLGVALTDDGFIKHDAFHRTNVPGVYCAGDVEGGYKQIVTATGQGSAAAMTIFEDLINPYWKQKKQ